MPDFLDSLLECTKEYECPKRFYYWAGLSSVSAILKDKVWFDMGKNYKLYPNIYVLLYGPSGVRKGPAIALAEKIVTIIDNTRIINGRSSIEAIIKQLGTIVSRPGKEPLKDSCGFIPASELSSSLIGNPASMDIMTNLYDRIYNEDKWKYSLKVGESHTLTRPTITWFSATNEALFKDFVPEKNIHGGLIGRMFMIAENKPNRINSLMFDPLVVPDATKLAAMIKPLTELNGAFTMAQEERVYLDLWYQDFAVNIAPKLADETGFVSRVLDFVVKNAMLISCARRGDQIINRSDVDEAFEVTLPLILPTKKISTSLKKQDSSEIQKRAEVLTYLASRAEEPDGVGRKEILKNLGLRLDHEDLDKVINLLMQMGVVTIANLGGEVMYQLNMKNPKVAEYVKGFRK